MNVRVRVFLTPEAEKAVFERLLAAPDSIPIDANSLVESFKWLFGSKIKTSIDIF